MVLPVPTYLVSADIQDSQIRYLWDDWNVEQAEEPVDEELLARFGRMSHRAIVAFIVASAEWIVHRLRIFTDVTEPVQYLEAAWAQVIDWRYAACTWEERHVKNDWTGPVRGPIGIAMLRITYGVQQARENGYPDLRAAWISNLATHVMPDPRPYQRWCDAVVERLERLYPRDTNETLGDVVPREALDLAAEFLPEQTELLINAFLASLDPAANPYLNMPDRILTLGFPGRPYVFRMQEDREQRAQV